jgi:hypothetical protein
MMCVVCMLHQVPVPPSAALRLDQAKTYLNLARCQYKRPMPTPQLVVNAASLAIKLLVRTPHPPTHAARA